MFWNRRRSGSSLKFKVTVSYALLFSISSLLIFILFTRMARERLIQEGDRNALALAREQQRQFFVGGRSNPLGEFVPLEELPEDQWRLLEERFPDAVPVYLYRTTGEHGRYYTCYVIRSGECYEVQLSGGRLIFSRRLNPAEGENRLKRTWRQHLLAAGRENSFFQLLDEDGNALFVYPPAAQSFSGNSDMVEKQYSFTEQKIQQTPFRLLTYRFPDGKYLVYGRNISNLDQALLYDLAIFLPLTLVLTVVGCVIGYVLARQFTGGLKKINDTIDKISAGGDYSYRIDVKGDSEELRSVISRFNRLNNQTGKLMQELRQVTDNVAHDLRTPLTRMSGALELALSRPRDKADYYEACVDAAEECARMRDLVNTMLEITRTNAQPDSIRKEPLLLQELLSEIHELLSPLADDKQIAFELELPSEPCLIEADRSKLPRVISNLVDNALKFTPEGGKVTLHLKAEEKSYLLQVRDTGCGISETEISHVFDRFYRADASRAQGGFGLGLAFVKSVITAHNWNISVESTLGEGTCFTITIPRMNTENAA